MDNKLIIGLAVLAGAALILGSKKPKPVTSGLSGAAELAG